MWKCPKCGREFKSMDQNHYCGEPYKSIDEYIAVQPENVQPRLLLIREALRAALSDAKERISWRMPTYWKTQNIIHFASFKNHIGIYPGEQAMVHFSNRFTAYQTSKGALQLPHNMQLPLELIVEMAKWCNEPGNRQ